MEDGAALKKGQLRSVIALFLKMGFTAFGGPAAHIGMFEDEVVIRRHRPERRECLPASTADRPPAIRLH